MLRRRFLLSNQEKSGLPSEYEQLNFLQGNKAQYIDTGVLAKGKIKVDCEFERPLNNTREFPIIAARKQNNSSGFFPFYIFDIRVAYRYPKYTYVTPQVSVTANKKQKFSSTFSTENIKIEYNGDVILDKVPQDSANLDISFALFATNEEYGPRIFSNVIIYSLQIEQNGKKMRDFTPCLRKSDNKPRNV